MAFIHETVDVMVAKVADCSKTSEDKEETELLDGDAQKSWKPLLWDSMEPPTPQMLLKFCHHQVTMLHRL